MSLDILLGPIQLKWMAVIEDVSATGFSDRQLSGPFEHWVHRHRFAVAGESSTIVVDEIEATPGHLPLRRIAGTLMVLGLPIVFSCRALLTKRLLERHAASA